MTPEQFNELIERGNLRGLVAATRGLTEEQRQPLAEVATPLFKKYQRLAHFGINQDLPEEYPGERQELWPWLHGLAERYQSMTLKPALFLAFTAVGAESELRDALKFSFQTLKQHFFMCDEQIESVLDRRLRCFTEFFANAKHVAQLESPFIMPLIRAGIIEKSVIPTERYVQCLIWYFLYSHPELATRRRSDVILDMPDVIEDLWQGFESEVGFPSAENCDAYREQLPCIDSWADTFMQLASAGRLDRNRLLTAVRIAIAREDFSTDSQRKEELCGPARRLETDARGTHGKPR
jgi:hypothetical protein